MRVEQIKELVQKRLSEKRFIHTLNVAEQAVKLAEFYSLDKEKCEIAALLHDVLKEASQEELLQNIANSDILFTNIFMQSPQIWHAFAGANYIEKNKIITDLEIINAVRYHTTGKENMTDIEKVIFLSDYTSKERSFEGVDFLREQLFNNLNDAMYLALQRTVQFLIDKNQIIYPQTVFAYNYYYLASKGDKNE